MKKKFTAVVEEGSYEIEVVNERKEYLGTVYVNPTDVNIAIRARTAEKKIVEFVEEAQKAVQSTPDKLEDEAAYSKTVDMIEQLDVKIREQMNYIFDYDVSAVVFGNKNALSLSGGKFFVQRLLEGFMPVFEQISRLEQEASKKRIEKYMGDLT